MRQWVEGLVGPDYALPTIVAVAAVIALFVLLLIWRLLRGGDSTGGTYVAGGRNRKARLAVMDATAIDNYRRLVLVRRDDVEHLLLIGGSADVVVESNIRLGGGSPRAAPLPEPYYDQPEPEPAPVPPPAPPVMRPPPQRPAPPPPAPRPAPARVEPTRQTYVAPPPRQAPPPPANPRVVDDAFDDDLLRELEVELDADATSPRTNQRGAASIDDEMSRLLGDLSPNKR